MKKTIALIAELSDEQAHQLVEVLNDPKHGREVFETLPTETLNAFQKIIETAIEEKGGAVAC